MTAILRSVVASALLCMPFADLAGAGDPSGIWLTEGGKARVRIAACGGALCGTITWLKEPTDQAGKVKTDELNADASKRNRPVVGVPIVLGMKPSATPDKWAGQVYNVEDGKTYAGSLVLTGTTTLKLEGCALGGMVCRAQTWTRAN
jgi:uncharacterized protein (DUF2147 family)